jgi:hypothetical protein
MQLLVGVDERARAGARARWRPRPRRLLLLLAIMVLCCAAYLAGVWYGTSGRMTCTVTSPGEIRCATDAGEPAPAQPEVSPPGSGTA